MNKSEIAAHHHEERATEMTTNPKITVDDRGIYLRHKMPLMELTAAMRKHGIHYQLIDKWRGIVSGTRILNPELIEDEMVGWAFETQDGLEHLTKFHVCASDGIYALRTWMSEEIQYVHAEEMPSHHYYSMPSFGDGLVQFELYGKHGPAIDGWQRDTPWGWWKPGRSYHLVVASVRKLVWPHPPQPEYHGRKT